LFTKRDQLIVVSLEQTVFVNDHTKKRSNLEKNLKKRYNLPRRG
jgi:hypothetical protein